MKTKFISVRDLITALLDYDLDGPVYLSVEDYNTCVTRVTPLSGAPEYSPILDSKPTKNVK